MCNTGSNWWSEEKVKHLSSQETHIVSQQLIETGSEYWIYIYKEARNTTEKIQLMCWNHKNWLFGPLLLMGTFFKK